MKKWVKEYQCPGCLNFPETCYETRSNNIACKNHVPGTIQSNVGLLFLGLPKGFCRLGVYRGMQLQFFELFDPHYYDIYNIPVWKYKNENGHVFVRGLMPRLNQPFLHIYLIDCFDKIDCQIISDDDIANMD